MTPDVEGLLIAWLPAALAGQGWTVAVSDQLASSGESVAVYRVGGPLRDIVTDAASIAVDTKGRTKARSFGILAATRALVHSLQGDDTIGATVQRVQEFAGPAHLPTTDSPTRYTMTLSLDVTLI